VDATLEKVKLDLQTNPSVEPTVNIAQTILNLRKQRPNMVQTAVSLNSSLCSHLTASQEQYEFCYRAIADGIKELKKSKK
jgi:protein tyrosine phosphatase